MQGLSREVVNRIQALRKSSDLQLTDRIEVECRVSGALADAIARHDPLIRRETLAVRLDVTEQPGGTFVETYDVGEDQLVLAITVASRK